MLSNEEIRVLLEKWEEVYKRGLLSFWLLLLLHERPYYPYEIKDVLAGLSQGTISADSNSIYRALNRFEETEIVTSEVRQSDSGPARRYYRLTDKGTQLLGDFIQRNILIYSNPLITERIRAVLRQS